MGIRQILSILEADLVREEEALQETQALISSTRAESVRLTLTFPIPLLIRAQRG